MANCLTATTVAKTKNTINKVGTLEPTTREISTQSGHPPQKLKNSNTKSKMSFIALLLGLFLFGTANIFAQQIWNVNDWNNFANNPNQFTNWELMADIGPVTQMVVVPFTGSFNGNNRRITVNITSNAPNVGLFSQVSGSAIYHLVIDGFVTGGLLSENVGGLVGQVSSGQIFRITNLADVIGNASNSSVGGIAGAMEGDIYCVDNTNNGTIMGGRYVAGIIGKVAAIEVLFMKYCKNAGVIGDNNKQGLSSYIAGIIAYVTEQEGQKICISDVVNIGKILSQNFDYSGGLVAHLGSGYVHASSSSGIVSGATNTVGGVVGYLGNAGIYGCINTNWVERGSALNFGSIVGFNNSGTLVNCYYDNQMSILGGINNNDIFGEAEGRNTIDMLGYALETELTSGTGIGIYSDCGCGWYFQDNLYPSSCGGYNHPIYLLSAAPIYLQNNERLDNVTQNFFVSNFESLVPPMFNPFQPIEFPYRWGWYPGGGFIPFSMMNFINVPFSAVPPFLNNATIMVPSGGWDSIAVRLTQPVGADIYEKIVPINVNP